MSIPKPEPRVERFEKLGFGLFVHWGAYAVRERGEWAMGLEKISKEEYQTYIEQFVPKAFDADEIVSIAKKVGMKYIVFTTRHHDGFSLFDTKGLTTYDSVNSPAQRDFVKEFVDACNKQDIVPFLYHTTLDWYQESFEQNWAEYMDYLCRSVEILCTNYGEIGGLWFDGNWSKPNNDWQEDRMYGIIRKYQPNAMIINNTGLRARGKTGHIEIDSVTFEQGSPKPLNREGAEKYLACEMCQTMHDHWGRASLDFNYVSTASLIENLCNCRKVGANYLLNVGPDADGIIPNIELGMLEVLGKWMELFGEAMYLTKPANIKGLNKDFGLLHENGEVYLFVFDLPMYGDEHVTVTNRKPGPRTYENLHQPIKSIQWLDNQEPLSFIQDVDMGIVTLRPTPFKYSFNMVVRVAKVSFGS